MDLGFNERFIATPWLLKEEEKMHNLVYGILYMWIAIDFFLSAQEIYHINRIEIPYLMPEWTKQP